MQVFTLCRERDGQFKRSPKLKKFFTVKSETCEHNVCILQSDKEMFLCEIRFRTVNYTDRSHDFRPEIDLTTKMYEKKAFSIRRVCELFSPRFKDFGLKVTVP